MESRERKRARPIRGDRAQSRTRSRKNSLDTENSTPVQFCVSSQLAEVAQDLCAWVNSAPMEHSPSALRLRQNALELDYLAQFGTRPPGWRCST